MGLGDRPVHPRVEKNSRKFTFKEANVASEMAQPTGALVSVGLGAELDPQNTCEGLEKSLLHLASASHAHTKTTK